MAKMNSTITEKDAPEDSGFSPIPPGIYEAEIEAAELKQTSSKAFEAVNVTFVITGPTQGGRYVWGWYNYHLLTQTPTDKQMTAAKIGRGQLNQLCAALGINELEDTDQLLNQTVKLKIGNKKQKDQDGEMILKDYIKGYMESSNPSKGGAESAMPWEDDGVPF